MATHYLIVLSVILGSVTIPFWVLRYTVPSLFASRERISSEQTRREAALTAFNILASFGYDGFLIWILLKTEKRIPFYSDVSHFPLYYWVFTIVLLTIGFELWFYWTHRLLHTQPLYRLIHHEHHKSTSVQPLTGYALHPIEYFIYWIYSPAVVFLLPVHFATYAAVKLFYLFYVFYAHSGVRPIPGLRKIIDKILNCPLDHQTHHENPTKNFCLILRLLDSVFGTRGSRLT